MYVLSSVWRRSGGIKTNFLPPLSNICISYDITFVVYFLFTVFEPNISPFLSGNTGLELEPDNGAGARSKTIEKVEPEPKINNFGSATLI